MIIYHKKNTINELFAKQTPYRFSNSHIQYSYKFY